MPKMTDFDPYEELLAQRTMIEDLINHTNKLIRSNNILTDRVEYITSECAVLQQLYKNQQDRIQQLEEIVFDTL